MTLEDTVDNVKINKETSVDFQFKEGIRQVEPLSVLFLNILLEKINRYNPVRGGRDWHILHKTLQVVEYADNLAVI